jgi:hypothetical protein
MVRDPLGSLEHEPEPVGHLLCPRLQDAFPGHPVKGVVDLDGGEPLGVIAQHLLLREFLGIEAPLPLLVAVPARADEEAHRLPNTNPGVD